MTKGTTLVRGGIIVIATMFTLFSMIQFLLNFAGSMGVVLQNQFHDSNALAQFGSAALFLTFLFIGLPGSGRFDGEWLQVGWTDVCDCPYEETVEALRSIDIYATR